MPTNTKKIKGVGRALVNALGIFFLLFSSLILLGIVFRIIGSIFFTSIKPLFHRSTKKMTHGLEEEEDRTLQGTEDGENCITGGPLWKK